MSNPVSPSPAPGQRRFLARSGVMVGIALKVTSVFVFVGMSALIKTADDVPVGELIFFRSFFALIPILAFLAWRGELIDGFKTRRPLGHIWRGIIGVSGMMLIFFALTRLPLPEAITINYATPLFIVIFSAVFLHEKIRMFRWSAVLVGFVGVVIIMWPRLTVFSGDLSEMGPETIGAIAAFCACITSAFAMLAVRRLVKTEASSTIVIYFSIVCSVAGLLTIPFGWVWPTPEQWAILILAGIAGGLGQVLLTESYRHAEMSTIAPFEYSSMLLSIAVGFFVFHEVPTPEMLIGGTIVVAAGIFIIFRERQLGLDRAKSKKVSTPA